MFIRLKALPLSKGANSALKNIQNVLRRAPHSGFSPLYDNGALQGARMGNDGFDERSTCADIKEKTEPLMIVKRLSPIENNVVAY